MKTLLDQDNTVQSGGRFGPDPILLRKKGLSGERPRNISEYKKKILDDRYMEHAINRIAMELSHFLSK